MHLRTALIGSAFRRGAMFPPVATPRTMFLPKCAFDAVTMRELWNNKDEVPYRFSKFVPPTIAGDRLFVPTCGLVDGGAGRVLVYGR